MARERVAFGIALNELRRRLRSGVLLPGAPIEILELASSLQISSTPVREALSRLTGEGLLSEDRGRGFHARRLDAEDVSLLYRRHAHLVVLALELAEARAGFNRTATDAAFVDRPEDGSSDARSPSQNVESFWRLIVRSSDNEDLIATHSALSDRLSVVRRAEDLVLTALDAELSGLSAAADSRKPAAIAEASAVYHSRRLASVGIIAAAIRHRSAIKPF